MDIPEVTPMDWRQYRPHMQSEVLGQLAAALALAQGEIAQGPLKSSSNPFFKSTYADLASVVEAIRIPLSKNGLAYVQRMLPSAGESVQVETVLMHASGEWISGTVALPVSKKDAQGVGSAITYARRYGLSAIVGVAPEDDDGNAAAQAAPESQRENSMMPKARAQDDVRIEPGPEDFGSVPDPLDAGHIPQAHVVQFEIKKVQYATRGMTKAQMLRSFDLVPLVNKKLGKGYAESMLRGEFKHVSRSELDEETAERYLLRLAEIASGGNP